MAESSFYASGKLLLFGEYLVLRGARSLATPLRVGQRLTVTPSDKNAIIWKCFEGRKGWFQARFSNDLSLITTTSAEKAESALKLLKLVREINPGFPLHDLELRFDLEFNRNFGFGTSSTLVSLMSQWTGIDPYFLLGETFGGSGYDVAAATLHSPFTYQLKFNDAGTSREIRETGLSESITNHLLFIYSGTKQNSRKQVATFRGKKVSEIEIEEMNTMVDKVLGCSDIVTFEKLMDENQKMLSGIIKLPYLKRRLFRNYPFSVKWLGAWGGDFIMATYRDEKEARDYFRDKGMRILYPYNEIVK